MSDIDGTLIGSDEKLSPFARKTIIEMIDSGVNFTVASARSVSAIRHVLGDLPLKLPVISFNGAFLSDFHSDERFVVRNIEAELVHAIDELVCGLGLRTNFSTYEGEDRVYVDEIVNDGMAWYLNDRKKVKDPRLQNGFDRDHLYRQKVTCLNVIGDYDRMVELRTKLGDQFAGQLQLHLFENMYSPGWYWLTMHDRHATKGNACLDLCERMGISPNEMTVFGDHLNDIEMFKVAGRAIAVENAQAELKSIADKVIGHHDEDSVARYLHKIINGS